MHNEILRDISNSFQGINFFEREYKPSPEGRSHALLSQANL